MVVPFKTAFVVASTHTISTFDTGKPAAVCTWIVSARFVSTNDPGGLSVELVRDEPRGSHAKSNNSIALLFSTTAFGSLLRHQRYQDPLRCEWRFLHPHATGVVDGVGDGWQWTVDADFGDAFCAERAGRLIRLD